MIFLDFDGVLFDTVKEAYIVSVLSTGKFKSISEIDIHTDHYQNFRKLRYLISPAWNYKYLLNVIDTNDDLKIMKKNLQGDILKASKKDYKLFEENFFYTRSYLIREFPEDWLKLNLPFPFLEKIKNTYFQYKNLFYIITTKDKETVLKLLDLQNMKFDKSRVFDKDDYSKFGGKKNIINSLMSSDSYGIFIDDSFKHIQECSEINGLKCFQPNWGYVGLKEKTINCQDLIREILFFIESQKCTK